MVLWLLRIFLRLVRVNPESHFLGCLLEFIHHFLYLFFGGCKQHHVVGKSQVREAVAVVVRSGKFPSPFFFCQRCISPFKKLLKHCVEQQAGHRISLLRSFLEVKNVALFVCLYRSLLVSVNFPQEADVLVIDVARFKCIPNRFVRDGVESLHEVDRRCPHIDSPLMAFLFNRQICCFLKTAGAMLTAFTSHCNEYLTIATKHASPLEPACHWMCGSTHILLFNTHKRSQVRRCTIPHLWSVCHLIMRVGR